MKALSERVQSLEATTEDWSGRLELLQSHSIPDLINVVTMSVDTEEETNMMADVVTSV